MSVTQGEGISTPHVCGTPQDPLCLFSILWDGLLIAKGYVQKEREREFFLLVFPPRFRTFVPTYPLRAIRDQGNRSSTEQGNIFFVFVFFMWVKTQGEFNQTQ